MSQNERGEAEAINSMVQYICENAKNNQIHQKKEYIQFDDFLKLMLYELQKIEGSEKHGGLFGWNPFKRKQQPNQQQNILNDMGRLGQIVEEGVGQVKQYGQDFGQKIEEGVGQVKQYGQKFKEEVGKNVDQVTEFGQNIQKRLEDTKNNMINYISGIQLQMTNSIATITIIDMINKYTLLCLSNRYMDENYCIQTVHKYLQRYSEYSPLIKQCVDTPSIVRGGKLKSKKVRITKKILGGEPLSFLLIIMGVLTSITSLALAIKDNKNNNSIFDLAYQKNHNINMLNQYGRKENSIALNDIILQYEALTKKKRYR